MDHPHRTCSLFALCLIGSVIGCLPASAVAENISRTASSAGLTSIILHLDTPEVIKVVTTFEEQPPTITLTFPDQRLVGSLPERATFHDGAIHAITTQYEAPRANPGYPASASAPGGDISPKQEDRLSPRSPAKADEAPAAAEPPRVIRSLQIALTGLYPYRVYPDRGRVVVDIDHPASIEGQILEMSHGRVTAMQSVMASQFSERFHAMQAALVSAAPRPASPPPGRTRPATVATPRRSGRRFSIALPAPAHLALPSLRSPLKNIQVAFEQRTPAAVPQPIAEKRLPVSHPPATAQSSSKVETPRPSIPPLATRQSFPARAPLPEPPRWWSAAGIMGSALILAGLGLVWGSQRFGSISARFSRRKERLRRLQQLEGELEIFRRHDRDTARPLQETTAHPQDAREPSAHVAQQLATLQQQLSHYETQLSQAEQEVSSLHERWEAGQRDVKDLEVNLWKSEVQLNDRTRECAAAQQQRDAATTQLEDARVQAEAWRQQVAALQHHVGEGETRLQAAQQEAAAVREQWQANQQAITDLEATLDRVTGQLSGATQALDASTQTAAAAAQEAERQRQTQQTREAECERWRLALEEAHQREQDVREVLERLGQDLAAVRASGEQRRAARIFLANITIELVGEDKTSIWTGFPRDLSSTGLGFSTERELPALPLRARFTIPGFEKPVVSKIRLIWQQADGDSHRYFSGAQFLNLSPSIRKIITQLVYAHRAGREAILITRSVMNRQAEREASEAMEGSEESSTANGRDESAEHA